MNPMTMTPAEIRALSPEAYRLVLENLRYNFSQVMSTAEGIAKQLARVEQNCNHANKRRTENNSAWWCPDCGQYFGVDVSYSAETEAYFRELRATFEKEG